MNILNFPEVIVSDVNIIANEGGTLQDVADYLYEYHGFGFDIDLYYNELNEAEAPKASTGSKVKDHFKKHWKKYAAGAAVAGAAGYAGNKLYHKNKANDASKHLNTLADAHKNGSGAELEHHVKKGKFFGSLRKDTTSNDTLNSLNKHTKTKKWSDQGNGYFKPH